MQRSRTLYSKTFWTATGERALRTFAQALVAAIGTNAAGILDVAWRQALSVAALAAVLSVLTSIAAGRVKTAGPSLGPETITRSLRRTDRCL